MRKLGASITVYVISCLCRIFLCDLVIKNCETLLNSEARKFPLNSLTVYPCLELRLPLCFILDFCSMAFWFCKPHFIL